MYPNAQSRWYHSNRYNLDSACEHCGGIIRHEPWCVSQNPAVAYAFGAALGTAKLTLQDQLILHALGVAWNADSPRQVCPKALCPSGGPPTRK